MLKSLSTFADLFSGKTKNLHVKSADFPYFFKNESTYRA
jgi:hypothetical protein